MNLDVVKSCPSRLFRPFFWLFGTKTRGFLRILSALVLVALLHPRVQAVEVLDSAVKGQVKRAGELLISDPAQAEIRSLAKESKVPVLEWRTSPEEFRRVTDEILARRPRVLHVLAHGAPGRVVLGGQLIDSAFLISQADTFRSWGVEEIVLWSCQVGRDREFIKTLEEVTGARIASSTGLIGHETLGGSWDMVSSSGVVAPPFPSDVLSAWRHVLVTAYCHGVYQTTASGDPDTFYDE